MIIKEVEEWTYRDTWKHTASMLPASDLIKAMKKKIVVSQARPHHFPPKVGFFFNYAYTWSNTPILRS